MEFEAAGASGGAAVKRVVMVNGVIDPDPNCRAAGGYADPDPDDLAPATAANRLGFCRRGCGREQGAERDPGENTALLRFHTCLSFPMRKTTVMLNQPMRGMGCLKVVLFSLRGRPGHGRGPAA